MSTTKKKTDINKARLMALHKLGLTKEIKATKTLTDSQKKKVRDEWKKYGTIANASKGEYIKKDIKNFTDRDKKNLKESGYVVAGNKIFLPTHGYDGASIRTSWVRDKSTGKSNKVLEIVRNKGDRKREIEYIGSATDKMHWQERLIREYRDGKFKEGDYVGIKLFDNGTFEREIVTNLEMLFRYVNDAKWHDKNKEFLFDNLHLVKISVKDIRDIAANERTNKEINHSKYIRKKNSTKTKSKRLIGKVSRK